MWNRTVLLAYPVSSLRSFAAESSKPAASTKPPAERLKANPNDTNALNDYMMANIRRFMQQMESDSKGAEQLLSEMKGVIDFTTETDNRTSQTVARAGQVGDSYYEQQIELTPRTSLEELGNRLTGSPGDPKDFRSFCRKSNSEWVGSPDRSRSKPRPT